MDITCYDCGGTGEKFDFEKGDWVSPVEECEICLGYGTVDYCKQNNHTPDITGICTICGEEVVREVFSDYPPELD